MCSTPSLCFPVLLTGRVPACRGCPVDSGSVLAQVLPFGDLPAGILADFPPVGGAGGRGAVEAEKQAAQDFVLGGAVEVDNQELDGDLRQQLRRDVIDEGLVEDRVQGAFLHVGLLLGYALAAVEDVDLHIRI